LESIQSDLKDGIKSEFEEFTIKIIPEILDSFVKKKRYSGDFFEYLCTLAKETKHLADPHCVCDYFIHI
jgi:hypothetical protein